MYYPGAKPGKKYALNKQYALLSQLHLLTRVYGNSVPATGAFPSKPRHVCVSSRTKRHFQTDLTRATLLSTSRHRQLLEESVLSLKFPMQTKTGMFSTWAWTPWTKRHGHLKSPFPWLISAHAHRVQGYIHCRYCVSEYTGIKLDNCDKHVLTDCKNDHSTSKMLGHVTRHSINLISASANVIRFQLVDIWDAIVSSFCTADI